MDPRHFSDDHISDDLISFITWSNGPQSNGPASASEYACQHAVSVITDMVIADIDIELVR
jgi:hypothetical protein